MPPRYIPRPRNNIFHPFTGILKCPKCGKSTVGVARNGRNDDGKVYYSYRCVRNQLGLCPQKTLRYESVQKAFLEKLIITLKDFKIEDETNSDEFRLDTSTQLKHLSDKKIRIKELYIEGEISKVDYHKRMDNLQDLEEEILENLESFKQKANKQQIKSTMEMLHKNWHSFSEETKMLSIRSIFKSITPKVIYQSKGGRYNKPSVIEITDYEFK
ncbi:zinc ribbon domain-containing protein [Priestia taiwanensis]|uniref:Recombinase zinc beta ribbon domain-containing protein n=1 Tax=Priestia taiwanensis TaxID=1347902 RepID=A0A917EPD2_9BACI|nr:zinc ribbon domain-containing protein [Priestia taiwanensis]MBM7362428.1 hypothetical protein [Priestia taiwanensis]GGE62167.1 hypothetical protein GCM10007140_10520 [Priestia taiwanensis]